MDQSKVKALIVEWVKIDRELVRISDERKLYNKQVKEHTTKLKEKQKQMENPILQMMGEIDTDSITLGNGLLLNSKQISKTNSISQPHIKQRIKEYLGTKQNMNYKLLNGFINNFNINVNDSDVHSYLNQYKDDETQQLFEYIVDITARKIYFDEEKLSIGKRAPK